MEHRRVLFTGGTGLLGKRVRQLMPDAAFPAREAFDITKYDQMKRYLDGKDISIIFHAAAFTSPPKINENPLLAIEVNVQGTCNLVRLCIERSIKLIYMCTDYVFKGDKGSYKEEDPVSPANKYAWSKLGGECAVRMLDNSLIIRASFGDVPFPYEKAFVDQWTSRLSVDELAPRLVRLIASDMTGTVHLGGKRQTVYEYATGISPEKNIGKLSLSDVSFVVPRDTSLDTSRYDSYFNEK